MNHIHITLFNLLHFMPLNHIETELYKFDKNTINRFINNLEINNFYLGGQIHMKYNDKISLDIVKQTREMLIEKYRNNSYSNESFQYSLFDIHKELDFIEDMVETYKLIMRLREKNKQY